MLLSKDQVKALNRELFIQEIGKILQELEEQLPRLQTRPQDTKRTIRVYRGMTAIRGAGQMFGFDEVAGIAQTVMNALEPVCNQESLLSPELLHLTQTSFLQIRSQLK